jgi:nucleoside-diphosphate-sugar epimerase
MRILITGGCGFIGMYVTQRLIQEGHEVFIVDIAQAPPKEFKNFFSGSVLITGDILSQIFLFETVKKNRIERIIHLVATRNWYSQEYPYFAFNMNCMSTINCFEIARLCDIERVAFASTVGVFGSNELYKKLGLDPNNLLDDTLGKPFNVYGVTKLSNELMAQQYCNRYGMSIVGFRLPLIFGPGKKGGSKTSRYNNLIEKSYFGEPVSVSAKVDQNFNIQYVKDSAKAAVCSCLANNPNNIIYNTGGYTMNIYGYVEAIKKVISNAKIDIIEESETDICDTCINSDLAKKEINYFPDFTIEEGIEDHIKSMETMLNN